MRSAIPAAELAGAKLNAIAEGTPGTAFDAEMQHQAVPLFYAAATGGIWLPKGWLAVSRRHGREQGREQLGARVVRQRGRILRTGSMGC